MSENSMAGKTAIVTGGGSGIGKSISWLFAKQGAEVIILDTDEAAAQDSAANIKKNNGTAMVLQCDVSNYDMVTKSVVEIIADFKKIDILVNNAGIAHVGDLLHTSETDLDRLYKVNVKGVYNCMHATIPHMIENNSGVILNLASIASKIGLKDRFAYSMTKGAVLTMTLSVAKDYIDENIRCNCICPARVHTPFVDSFIKENYPGKEAEMYRYLADYQPIGRMGTPDEIAGLAAFLCSDAAAFITGCAYDIDGGVINLR